jgi:hypothetical protein
MLTLHVVLVDIDEHGAQYNMGDGGVQTAPTYYQALRAASSSSTSMYIFISYIYM